MRCTRTSTRSTPNPAALRLAWPNIWPVTAARSAETICCSVRCATTLLMPSLTISARRSPASSTSPPVAVKYSEGSLTRHFT